MYIHTYIYVHISPTYHVCMEQFFASGTESIELINAREITAEHTLRRII